MAVDLTREDVLDRLAKAMDAPLTQPGSQAIALEVIEQFTDSLPELMAMLGDKMLATLSDGERHDTLALSTDRTVALWFIVWPGSHHEVRVDRIGEYFGQLAGKIQFLVNAGVPLEGFLEIDAYVEEGSAGLTSTADEKTLDVGVEYSFLPAEILGGSKPSNPHWQTVLLNPDLLSVTERHGLGKFMA